MSGTCLFSRQYHSTFLRYPPTSSIRPEAHLIRNRITRTTSKCHCRHHYGAPSSSPCHRNSGYTKIPVLFIFCGSLFWGHCNREYINFQLDAIDQRHNQVAGVFIKAIEEALDRRGVIDRGSIQIKVRGGLVGIAPYIYTKLHKPRPRRAICTGSAAEGDGARL